MGSIRALPTELDHRVQYVVVSILPGRISIGDSGREGHLAVGHHRMGRKGDDRESRLTIRYALANLRKRSATSEATVDGSVSVVFLSHECVLGVDSYLGQQPAAVSPSIIVNCIDHSEELPATAVQAVVYPFGHVSPGL